jgi:transcriptional regulator with XRE-family HTH domain
MMGTVERDPPDSRSSWAAIVGSILEEARRRAGKGPALALRLEQLGVVGEKGERYSESSISNWIRGRAKPPAEVVLAAAQAAEISLDDRLGIGHKASGLERQLHEVQAELAQQRSNSAAMERRLEDLAARLEGRESLPSTSGSTLLLELIRLDAELADVGHRLGRRWASEASWSRAAIQADSHEDVVARIGTLQARMSEVAGMVGVSFTAYPAEPSLPTTDELFSEWLGKVVEMLRQQMPAIQSNASRVEDVTAGGTDRMRQGAR